MFKVFEGRITKFTLIQFVLFSAFKFECMQEEISNRKLNLIKID